MRGGEGGEGECFVGGMPATSPAPTPTAAPLFKRMHPATIEVVLGPASLLHVGEAVNEDGSGVVGEGSGEHVAGELGVADGNAGEIRDVELVGVRVGMGEVAPCIIINGYGEGVGGVENSIEDAEGLGDGDGLGEEHVGDDVEERGGGGGEVEEEAVEVGLEGVGGMVEGGDEVGGEGEGGVSIGGRP